MLEQRTFSEPSYEWQTERRIENPTNREAAYAILRIAMGMVFLISGVGKFMGGVGQFAAGMQEQFAGKLPAEMVSAFAHALPFAEVGIGALLVLGLFNVGILLLAGLLMIMLTAGVAMKPDPPTMAHNVFYAFVISALLWLSNYNGFSLDRLIHRSTKAR